jgi:nitrate reductase gamma subunit
MGGVELSLTEALLTSTYFTILVFAAGLIYVWIKWSRKPLHLRWELYPVPHEPGRTHYGGSYMEEVDWSLSKPSKSLIEELKEMLKEMLFLKRVYMYNRPLWYLTFLFHGGIYMILLWFASLLVNSLTTVYLFESTAKTTFIEYLIIFFGYTGVFATTIGAVGLLVKRIVDSSMREYTSKVDYFNLSLILVVLITGLAALGLDPFFEIARKYMMSIVSFQITSSVKLPPITTLHIVLLQLLWIYIPYSKMSHFLGKWFTYHKVLWDDEPNIRGGRIEYRVKEVVRGYKIPWGGPHMKKDRSWLENASEVE